MNQIDGKKVIVIGAGFTGLAAAYELACAGAQVMVLERDSDIGGLAGTFSLPDGSTIEKFYHHWFASDQDIVQFITQIGCEDRIKVLESRTGLFYANSIFRLSSPRDLLKFTPLPMVDRIRTGLMALYARLIGDWTSLESQTAEDWLISIGGQKGYDVIWKPLLEGKFGPFAPEVSAVWFWNKLKLRGSSRDSKGSERLIYYEGGFHRLGQDIRKALEQKKVQIVTECAAQEIICDGKTATAVRTPRGIVEADAIISTVPLPQLVALGPTFTESFKRKLSQVKYLGNVCLVLRLSRSLTDTYWLNVADPSFPFVGIIEHTNFDSVENYGGAHIAYISKYLPTSDELYQMEDVEILEYCLPYIKRIVPEFSPEWILSAHVWKAPFSQPIITKHYSDIMPAHRSPMRNLWISTMAQIYPEDRGTNYAVKQGREVAQQLLKELRMVNSLSRLKTVGAGSRLS